MTDLEWNEVSKPDPAEVQRLMTVLDGNGDGNLTEHEFTEWCLNGMKMSKVDRARLARKGLTQKKIVQFMEAIMKLSEKPTID